MGCARVTSRRFSTRTQVLDRLQSLPSNGGKIANKTLRTPEFRQGALAEDLVKACEKLRQASDSHPTCAAEDEALTQQLFEDEGPLSLATLEVLFGDCLHSAVQALRPRDADGAEGVERNDLLRLLGAMDPEERAAFVLGASSLLSNWAAAKFA